MIEGEPTPEQRERIRLRKENVMMRSALVRIEDVSFEADEPLTICIKIARETLSQIGKK